ncbi:MAG: hypothetical protein C0404_07430 [Verrucomicrobia bacterium]|nr:hypothetical protein [Verrucomicrobiota bacterium]
MATLDLKDSDLKLEGADGGKGEPYAGNPSLPKVLDPAVTMDLVQRFVETERNRNRRVVLWITTVFLAAVLCILVLFIWIGIFVQRNSRTAREAVDSLMEQAASNATEVVGVSYKLKAIEKNSEDIKAVVETAQEKRNRENKALKTDLERFSKWIATKDDKGARRIAELEGKLKELEETEAMRQRQWKDLNEQYAAALKKIRAGASSADAAALPEGDRKGSRPAEEMSFSRPADAPDQRLVESDSTNEIGAIFEMVQEPVLKQQGNPRGPISAVKFPNGDRYEGEFKDGLMNGWGTYEYRNGDRYEGEFKSDMKHGKGTYTYRNGDKFIGELRNDMKENRGSFLFHNGDRYVGEFRNDMISGKGTMLYQNGNKFAGDFVTGVKCGNGVFCYANGDVYKGEFRDDTRNGKGTYFFNNGTKYMGEFKNGLRHGKGRYIYSGGEEYVGDFKQGNKDGFGVCIYPDGKRLNGVWKDDRFLKAVDG